MTVASETNRSGPYNGNGVTTVFDYEFRIISQAHLRVIKTVTATGAETTLALEADYTVSGVGASGGGQITALVAPAAGETITILRKVPFVQETDLENQGAYYAETVETVADLAAMRDQELQEQISRAVMLPPAEDPGQLAGLVADILRLADSADNIDTVAGVAANVSTVAGIAANVSAVSAVAAAVTTVAGVAANVSTVAGSIAAVNNASANMAAIIAAPAAASAADASADAAEAAQTAAEGAAGASLTNATSRAAAILRTFPATVTHVITGGYGAVGDRGGAALVDGDGTSPGGFTDAGARAFQIIPSHERISLRQAGVVLNDESAASANRIILNALSTWCEARKIDIEVDKGICYIEANNGLNTGWNLYPSAGTGFLRIYGHGDDSVIKRPATTNFNYSGVGAASSASLTWLYSNALGKLLCESFLIDGNEANCAFADPPEWVQAPGYAHEQVSNMRMRTGTGTFESLELYGMRMTGCIGDGFLAATPMNRFVADDFKSWGRTRRVRSDIQLSRIPLVTTVINNFEGDAFEMEPSFTNTTHQMFLSQMVVRGALDLAGNVSGDPNPANILGSDIVALNTEGVGLNFVNFFRVKGKFRDCIFVAPDRIQRCQVEFQGGEFRLRASETYTTSAQPVAIWNDGANNSVKFDRTHFRLESGVSVQTGTYVVGEVVHNDLTRVMEFNECTTDGVLDSFLVGAYGSVAIRGGNPAATRAVFGLSGTNTTKEHICLEPSTEWSGAYLLRIQTGVTVTTPGDCVVSVAGEFASAKMLPIEHWSVGSITLAAGNVSAGDTITINGHLITFVAVGAVGAQINIGATHLLTVVALINYINAHRVECGVSASGSTSSAIASLTAVAAGTAGNVTLAKVGANITVSGGALTGGGIATTGTAITWRTTAKMVVPSTPAAVIKGFPGLSAKLDMPSYGSLKEWTYEPTLAQVGRYNDSALWRPVPVVIDATAVVNPASIAPGQRTVTATIAVPGAALGDIVKASFSLDLAPVKLVAWISAADTVAYYFENPQALLTGSATYDAPSIAAGAEVTTNVTVTGAAVGDVLWLAHGVDQAGLTIDGYVSAANTVTAVVRNGTAGAVDLASATLRAVVLPVTATDIGSGTLKVRVEK